MEYHENCNKFIQKLESGVAVNTLIPLKVAPSDGSTVVNMATMAADATSGEYPSSKTSLLLHFIVQQIT